MDIELKNIEIAYPDTGRLFTADSLDLKKGELVALIGANGSGKSSLIRCLGGLKKDFLGEIRIGDASLNSISTNQLAKLLSLVLTDGSYPQIMPVEDFVAFGRYPFTNWFGQIKAEDHEQLENALEACGLLSLRKKAMHELSDGERQRTLIARCICQNTNFLILDEPGTHLDTANSRNLIQLLKSQAKEHQKAVLFSSHQVLECLPFVDKLWLIREKEILEIKVNDFLQNKELVRLFLGEEATYTASDHSLKFKWSD